MKMFLVNPRLFITDAIGTRRIPPPSLVMMGILLYVQSRLSRSPDAAHTGRVLRSRMRRRWHPARLIGVMILAVVAGILTTFWAYLTLAYDSGGDNINVGLGNGAYANMRNWL